MSIVYNTNVVRNGLVLQLDAANKKSYPGSGNTWYDLSGFNNTAALSGTTYNADGMGAINCPIGTETITIPDSSSLQSTLATDSFTISTIVKSTDISYPRSRHPLWIQNTRPDATIKGFTTAEGGSSTSITLEMSDGVNYVVQYPANTISETTVYFRSFVVNRGSTIDYYLNTKLIYSMDISTVTGSIYTSGGIQFGNVQGWRFIGDVYSMSIHNRALSAAEITQNYNALRGRYGI